MDDQEYPVLVMKVGYRLLPMDGQPGQFRAEVLDEAPPALCTADRYYGEEGASSVCEESDLAPFKPRCDVIVVGNAYAPQGQPAAHWTASLRVSAPVAALPRIDVPLPTPLSPGERLTEYQLAAWQAARQQASQLRANAPSRHYLLDMRLKFTGPRQFWFVDGLDLRCGETPWALAAVVLTVAYTIYTIRLNAITHEALVSLERILNL